MNWEWGNSGSDEIYHDQKPEEKHNLQNESCSIDGQID
jgi:hypothetical protein